MSEQEILAIENAFRQALANSDTARLEQILAPDFILNDLSGTPTSKPALLASLSSGNLKFEAIHPIETNLTRYGDTAIVTGRTEMRVSFQGTTFFFHSRFLHVYLKFDNRWRLVAAQGTPIAQ